MKTGTIPHFSRPVPRIVCGTDFLTHTPPHQWFHSFDAYWEAGGRAFDTAHCYGPNSNLFAAWTTSRGVRREVIYFDKGCHPYGSPRVTYHHMKEDIYENHRRLGVDRTDFFVLHRDDENIPVGEIVDWLNEFKRKGLIEVFGGSNWRTERIIAANAYAEKASKQGFSLSNPNLSLAIAQEPIWAGCLTIDPFGRQWHRETNFPLFPWSSTARGYFAHTQDPDVLRSFDNEANRARRARAEELAARHGVSAVQIALAWTLAQGNVFALCGLRTVENVKENVAVLDLDLTPEEVRWLEHGDEG
jgi:aryl-alcohol dehydrogenase-like predicted oxidoreductase